ncbi:hypothetical protein ACKWMY_27555, partial [Serratia sp. J2]|uniref:hypothetical protein n=1 Tax=Serratia sp. J2 TaxID=3386551 RepID=UPI00391722C4
NNFIQCGVSQRTTFFLVHSAAYNYFFPVHSGPGNFFPRRAFSARFAIFPNAVKEQPTATS